MTDFYVYIHRKATTGEIFYVGKGKANRAFDCGDRNEHWNRTVRKHSHNVEIVESGLQEWYALELEMGLIAYYGRKDLGLGSLVNMTDGGDGLTNPTQEIRKKIGEKSKGRKANLGNTHSESSKKRMSESQKLRFKDPVQREIARAGKLGKPRSPTISVILSALFKGKPHSPEWNKKVGEARKGNQVWLGKRHNSASIEKMRESRKLWWANKKEASL